MDTAQQARKADVLVIGSGAAGLSAALHLAPHRRVVVLSKGPVDEGSTRYAQGGISAVLDRQDSFDAHIDDTIDAGAGLCDADAVRRTVAAGPEAIQWLLNLGVPFTRESFEGRSRLHLTREGGHSARRVAHAADATGRAIEDALVRSTGDTASIDVLERHVAVDLITSRVDGVRRVVGAYVQDTATREVQTIMAPTVIMATGGASRVYLYSSNPDGATGDGIAMAWRAGCRIANMEFMQFHPTCLYHPRAKSFLISEAVRGEGGLLKLPDGERFMPRFDERAELAPRDIVARAVDHEMKRLGIDHVYLDISHKAADFIREHFPTIHERCLEYGFDMTREPLPVVPAAHYTCGGVVVNHFGQTDLPGLYAAGEVSCTGLHGANRMASNSLLECLVYARAAAEHILSQTDLPAPEALPVPAAWDESRVTESEEEVVVAHDWDELRRLMWDYVGIVRTRSRLLRAQRRIRILQEEIHEYYSHYRISPDLIELRNLGMVAEIIVQSALARRESRGLHYLLDYPERDPELDGIPTVLVPPSPAGQLAGRAAGGS
ncbi:MULTISPECIES: L-aspartate oxidase [Thioalkalivibrio]|uniref:L-aspartate oxidase n=1 Tax=Thioalkalivibrio halophilus TaxID=252474 RepID=A0A1V3A0C4_9GAMM|nr:MULTISPECIES: L-aspartate oxidase [Thioalkalivibrio]OOC10766.1 L-aspartate oxidase [Thioalkalivibrio halophilus]PYG04495.1 L-aspartate oxidase [Thioalkalivibrio sp. ALE21]